MLSSKFVNILLVLLAALFVFGGAYLSYVLQNVLDVGYFVSIASGFALFAIGLVLVWFLIRRKLIP